MVSSKQPSRSNTATSRLSPVSTNSPLPRTPHFLPSPVEKGNPHPSDHRDRGKPQPGGIRQRRRKFGATSSPAGIPDLCTPPFPLLPLRTAYPFKRRLQHVQGIAEVDEIGRAHV